MAEHPLACNAVLPVAWPGRRASARLARSLAGPGSAPSSWDGGSIRTATSERGGLPGRGVTTIVHSDGATAGPW